mmetsp:Transcript_3701/g.6371  ORF Transcript_3701/g.6371 Transcript_3701/m.6371 type:complete len:349 (+) Transcript_3701:3123-4169(+)
MLQPLEWVAAYLVPRAPSPTLWAPLGAFVARQVRIPLMLLSMTQRRVISTQRLIPTFVWRPNLHARRFTMDSLPTYQDCLYPFPAAPDPSLVSRDFPLARFAPRDLTVLVSLRVCALAVPSAWPNRILGRPTVPFVPPAPLPYLLLTHLPLLTPQPRLARFSAHHVVWVGIRVLPSKAPVSLVLKVPTLIRPGLVNASYALLAPNNPALDKALVLLASPDTILIMVTLNVFHAPLVLWRRNRVQLVALNAERVSMPTPIPVLLRAYRARRDIMHLIMPCIQRMVPVPDAFHVLLTLTAIVLGVNTARFVPDSCRPAFLMDGLMVRLPLMDSRIARHLQPQQRAWLVVY